MSPPGLLHAILPLALVLATSPAVAGDELLQEVAAYRYGQSREPLFRLSDEVRASRADPSARREMETRLVGLVESDATIEAREFACRQLRLVGTAAAVPALSPLLGDSRLGDMALLALASIPDEEATVALSQALETSSGRLRVGLVHALAMRGVRDPAFAALAEGDDREAAAAATWALGRTGDVDDAWRILERREPSLEAREAALAIAERSGASGEPVFRRLLAPGEPATVRVAALRGIVRLEEREALPDLAAALRSDAAPLQAEAIDLAASGEGVDLLIETTPELGPAARRRALTVLAAAGVSRALPLMLASLEAREEAERGAALGGIGALGGPGHVALLAEKAATTSGPERVAARAALDGLRGAGVDEALVDEMKRAGGGTKRELIRAAGERGAVGATDALLVAATSSDAEVRLEALGALGKIAPAAAASPTAGLLRSPMDGMERQKAEGVLAAALRRNPGVSLDPVMAAFDAATTANARASLVAAAGRSARDDALPFLQRALAGGEATVQRAAILALGAWPTAEPAPDLMAMARSEVEDPLPVLALRGYIRLVSAPSALSPEEVAARLAPALETAGQPEEKKAVLAALQQHACAESLALAQSLLDDPDVAPEARLAVDQIEDSLSYRNQGDTMPNSRLGAGN